MVLKAFKSMSLFAMLVAIMLLAGCGGDAGSDSQDEQPAQKVYQVETIPTSGTTEQSKPSEEAETAKTPEASKEGEPLSESSPPLTQKPEETQTVVSTQQDAPKPSATAFRAEDVPAYSGQAYVALNDNVPYFDTTNLSAKSYESYSSLDSLGRCGVAASCIGQDIMPTEERGSIGQVKPSGWHTIRYDFVDGKYLYNRCHLIGYQLSGENANTSNLITGTRYMNIEGMLPFENMTADYVKETGNHVEYHVTPVFKDDNLLADGVLMEGYSVEDQGDGICFCVFAYNAQPGVNIDYATGDSSLAETAPQPTEEKPANTPAPSTSKPPAEEPSGNKQAEPEPQGNTYILNTNTKKFHYPSCSSVDQMKESNKKVYTGSREDIINQGYVPCKRCNP